MSTQPNYQDYIVTATVLAVGLVQVCAAKRDDAKAVAMALHSTGAQRIMIRKWDATAEHYSEIDGAWNQSVAA